MNMGLLKAYNGLLGAFVTVFGLYHVFLPYHAIELYGEYDPAPPPPAPPSPSLRHSGARLYEHRTPATGAWFITMMGIMMMKTMLMMLMMIMMMVMMLMMLSLTTS